MTVKSRARQEDTFRVIGNRTMRNMQLQDEFRQVQTCL